MEIFRRESTLPAEASKSDLALVKAIARAHGWFKDLVSGRAASTVEIAARDRLVNQRVASRQKLSDIWTRWRRTQSGANSSLTLIPCYQGKIQGKAQIQALMSATPRRISQRTQRLVGKFPTLGNREFETAKQGISKQEQGIRPSDRGFPSPINQRE